MTKWHIPTKFSFLPEDLVAFRDNLEITGTVGAMIVCSYVGTDQEDLLYLVYHFDNHGHRISTRALPSDLVLIKRRSSDEQN